MASNKEAPVKLDQLFAWARTGDLESLQTKVPAEMLSKADATGQRAMHVAATYGQTHVIEWLVEDEERDTGVNKPDEDARGPLHLAAWHGHAETVKALLEMGAIRDRPTRTGFTPLHYACFSGNLETVKTLVEFGAKIDARDESQQTPGDVAKRFKHDTIAEYMAKEAPLITDEARRRYAYMGAESSVGTAEAAAHVSDPMMEVIQSNEEANLERVLKTASRVAVDTPLSVAPPPQGRARSRKTANVLSIQIDKQILVGAGMFAVTLALGLILGRLSAAQQQNRTRE